MAKRIVNFLILLVGLFLHLAALYVLYQAFLPVARWYWEAIPVRGVDLLNTTTLVAYLGRHFATLPLSWKYIAFNGEPLILDYPSLHLYAALPFLSQLAAVRAVQFWMLVTTFAFLVFSYLLFARLSRNRGLALFLAILGTYSVNLYGALIWGGSVPYFGTQMFLPLTLLLLVLYFQTGKKRWFAGAILALGVSQYGHPQVALSYGFALSIISLLTAPREQASGFRQRIVETVLFMVLVFFIGFPVTAVRLPALVRMPAQILSGLSGEIPVTYQATPGPALSDEVREFYRTRIYHFYTDSHPWLFLIAGAGVVVFLLVYFSFTFIRVMVKRQVSRSSVFSILWVTLLVGYTTGYLYLYSIGIDIFHGGWYRVFWPVPLLIGCFTSVCWGEVFSTVVGRSDTAFRKVIDLGVDVVLLGVVVILGSRLYLSDFDNSLYFKSVFSAGFPGRTTNVVDRKDQEDFAKVAVPPWVPVQTKDYRLYSADQIFNIWFNSYYDMPLARGYIDPAITDAQRWGIFLMDIVLDNNVAVEKFDYPVEMSKNAARFVLDWNAIRYLAGESYGSGSSVVTTFSSYLPTPEFSGRDEKWAVHGARLPLPGDIRGGRYEPSMQNWVRFLEIQESLVGPILSLTNAPSVLFVGDEPRWEIFIRTLAQLGLTSRQLIPVKGPKFLDQVRPSDLVQFDAVFLYGYDYRNHGKAWNMLVRFVEGGGAVLVDTGAEVKESESVALPGTFPRELPALFPMVATHRGDLGMRWEVEADPLLSGIAFGEFAPLIYDGGPWNVSYAEDSDIDDKASVLLRLSGKPVIATVQVGSGTAVWSGLNLAAHLERNRNLQEGELLKTLLRIVLPESFSEATESPEFDASFVSASHRRVSGDGTRGVLFKESRFPGWSARLTSEGKGMGLTIWRTGLGYPGVMWARIPPDFEGKPMVVDFRFRGAFLTWLEIAASAVIGIILLDKFLFNGRVFGALVRRIWNVLLKHVGRWCEREEE